MSETYAEELQNKSGRPRKFKNESEFMNCVKEYFLRCEKYKRMPTKQGFYAFIGITKQTFYDQEKYYPETFQIIESLFVDGLLNTPTNSSLAQMALANNHGFKRTDTAALNEETFLIDISDEELEQQLKKAMLYLEG